MQFSGFDHIDTASLTRPQEAYLPCLLQRHPYSAAAALMKAALQLAGVRLPEVL